MWSESGCLIFTSVASTTRNPASSCARALIKLLQIFSILLCGRVSNPPSRTLGRGALFHIQQRLHHPIASPNKCPRGIKPRDQTSRAVAAGGGRAPAERQQSPPRPRVLVCFYLWNETSSYNQKSVLSAPHDGGVVWAARSPIGMFRQGCKMADRSGFFGCRRMGDA